MTHTVALAGLERAVRGIVVGLATSAPIHDGGLGTAELPVDSAAERVRRQMRGHASVSWAVDPQARPAAMHEQIVRASRRSLAFT